MTLIRSLFCIHIKYNKYSDRFRETTEVIRLLLLSQRIEFRYDSVFAENAFELAEAMIALKKPEAAYNYLVRENTVLTTESDSIYFFTASLREWI